MQPDTTLPTPAIKTIKGTIEAPLEAGAIPTFTILQNTIGEITWTKISTGYFKGTKTGAFPAGKTICMPGGNGQEVFGGIGVNLPFDHGYNLQRVSNDNELYLSFQKTSDYTYVDPYDILSSGPAEGLPFEINVYK